MDATGKPDLPGFYELYGIIIIAVPIALLVSLALLRIYRRSVVRSMQQRGTSAAVGVLENRPARCGEPPGVRLRSRLTTHHPTGLYVQ
jgi:hypothetical protein